MNVFSSSSPIKSALMGVILTVSSMASARYVVADYAGKGIDPTKKTHVIVAGKGTDMGLQFHMSAASQARKIMDVNPNDQVMLIAVLDDGAGWFEDDSNERRLETSLLVFNIINKNNSNDMTKANGKSKFYTDVQEGTKLALMQWGFNPIQEVTEELNGQRMINTLSQFTKIGSLNVYSHSTAWYGLILAGPSNRLDPEDANLAQELRSRFTSDAYAWFHGCNNGFLGMKFSTKWGIPVGTSFTSTAFQELFKKSDSSLGMIHGYPGNIPAGAKRVGVNPISFKKTYECSKVPCVRMMPDNYGYSGHWGNFKDGGLGFYRFNCGSSVDSVKCKTGMARGLINHVSLVYTDYGTDLATFKKSAQDYLCPSGAKYVKTGYTYESCADTLEKSLTDKSVTLDTFMGKSLQCEGKTCSASIKCQKLPGVNLLFENSCSLTNRRDMSKPITTQVQEYRDLVEGFMLMKRQMGLPVQ